MENTTAPTLHPLRLGELLDQAIRVYRRNFFTFIGIAALGYIPYAIFQIGSSVLSIYSLNSLADSPYGIFRSPAYWVSILSGLLALAIYVLFVYGLCVPVLVGAITSSYMGKKIGILEAYRRFGPLWANTIGVLILSTILISAAVIYGVIIPIVGWFTGFGVVLFLASVVGQLLPAILVNEKLGGMDVISRGWDLGRRRFWWLIGFALLFSVFNLLVVTGPAQALNYLASSLFRQTGLSQYAPSISILLSTLSSNLVRLLILPIQLTAWTLVYFDLRVRTEGFDLALATNTPSEDVMTDIASIPASPRAEKWLTTDEIGKFLVITLAFGGVSALTIGVIAFVSVGLSSLVGH